MENRELGQRKICVFAQGLLRYKIIANLLPILKCIPCPLLSSDNKVRPERLGFLYYQGHFVERLSSCNASICMKGCQSKNFHLSSVRSVNLEGKRNQQKS